MSLIETIVCVGKSEEVPVTKFKKITKIILTSFVCDVDKHEDREKRVVERLNVKISYGLDDQHIGIDLILIEKSEGYMANMYPCSKPVFDLNVNGKLSIKVVADQKNYLCQIDIIGD